MASADATLLPPPVDTDDGPVSRGSSRTLDEVGVERVLGAMIEQRRASRPCASEIEPTLVYEETPRSRRVPADSDAFLKAR
jgi:hypothetical protein